MDPRTGVDGLDDDLARHRVLVGDSNPIYARALELMQSLLGGPSAERAIVERMDRAWRARSFRAYYERPLLLLASLRYEVLTAGADHPLARAFADDHPQFDGVTREALVTALDPDRLSLWLTLANRRVQTNDVSRAVAWRWPAAIAANRPLALVDVGCSAGLGLVADQLAAPWVDAQGRRLPVDAGKVLVRVGYDSDPIELFEADHVDESTWLRACIWPGDAARLRRLDSAIEAFALARHTATAPRIERVRARAVPARLRRLDREVDPDALVLVVQSFVREYLEESEALTYDREMRGWLRDIPRGRGLWMQLELAREGGEPAAELTAHPARGEPFALARCGYHPIAIDVQPGAPERLHDALVIASRA
jgi:hypothetical protein